MRANEERDHDHETEENSWCADAKNDDGDQGAPRWFDDGSVCVVVVDDRETYAGGCERGGGGDGVPAKTANQ